MRLLYVSNLVIQQLTSTRSIHTSLYVFYNTVWHNCLFSAIMVYFYQEYFMLIIAQMVRLRFFIAITLLIICRKLQVTIVYYEGAWLRLPMVSNVVMNFVVLLCLCISMVIDDYGQRVMDRQKFATSFKFRRHLTSGAFTQEVDICL